MKKVSFTVLIAIVVIVVIIMAVSGPRSSAPSQGDKIVVTASFYPLAFFAEKIGGDLASVANITPAGAEPHDYEPTTQDLIRIEKSRLVIMNGGGLEAWGDSVVENADPKKTKVVIASDGLIKQHMLSDGQTLTDPHVWLSPKLALKMVDTITNAFVEVDPNNENTYRVNADALKDDLTQLDAAYRSGLAVCKQDSIVTSHAAFGYLADEYGFHQLSITGVSPDAEPSLRQIDNIAKFVQSQGIRYIFFESLVSPKLSQTLAQETGAQTLVLNPLEGLTKEDLAAGDDYISVMNANLTNLKIALECTP